MTELIILGALLVVAALAVAWAKGLFSRAPSYGGWTLGPQIGRKNRSPRSKIGPHAEGVVIEIPHGKKVGDKVGELSAVLRTCGPLAGTIRARIRVEGAKLVPSQTGYFVPTATLFFQRKDDDWKASGRSEDDRWYATFATVVLDPGEHVVEVSLDDVRWSATRTSTAASNPGGFADAKANAESVGFVFGGGDGYAHGLYATGPAKLVLLGFEQE